MTRSISVPSVSVPLSVTVTAVMLSEVVGGFSVVVGADVEPSHLLALGVSVVVGDLFSLFNPWRALGRAAGALVGRLIGRSPDHLSYPDRLGRWPAAVGLGAFVWLEIIHGSTGGVSVGLAPETVATATLVYTVYTLAMMALFGVEKWCRNGEIFSVYFGMFSQLGIFEVRDGQLGRRRPLAASTSWARVPGSVAVVLLLTLPPGAPMRDATTGAIVGPTPFMDSLLFLITLIFLICGICYGIGARTISGSGDVIEGVTKTFSGLAGLVFMLLMIAQFIAYFNFTGMPRFAAIGMSDLLERAGLGAVPLLVGFIIVIFVLDFIIPGVIPKWAIFAPVFIPIFTRLGVTPQTVLAAYRVGDSPMNVVTPLMVYLPFIVIVAQRYEKSSGIGTIISLMIPYTFIVLGIWLVLFVLWSLLGIPLGPGYPVGT